VIWRRAFGVKHYFVGARAAAILIYDKLRGGEVAYVPVSFTYIQWPGSLP
jgi:hypothetical protein